MRREQLNAYYGLAVALEALGDLAGAKGAMRTYVHLGKPDDPYVRKAEAAVATLQKIGKQSAETKLGVTVAWQ